ncbi:MAG: hypothetical protein JO332_20430 [Planctomycetaceae bacterium]|nr:hypothetical protein [Planctomycetaceae bacterium]
MEPPSHARGLLPLLVAGLALPALTLGGLELLQRHRFVAMSERVDAALQRFQSKASLRCVSNERLALSPDDSPGRILWQLQTRRPSRGELRREWTLRAGCDIHNHGYGLEFRVESKRTILLRSPQVSVQQNVPLDPSVQKVLAESLGDVEVDVSYFEY